MTIEKFERRKVIVSSAAHSYARGKNLNYQDMAWNRSYKPWSDDGYSKLANILFAKELAKRLPEGQTENALHPGIIYRYPTLASCARGRSQSNAAQFRI